MERCFNLTSIVRGKTKFLPDSLGKVDIPFPTEMEHWHVPYDYPRANHAQAWLLKCLEGAIARDTDRECNWMFRQRCAGFPHGFPNVRRNSSSVQRGDRTNWPSRTDETKLEITSTFYSVREKELQSGVEGSHHL